MKQETHAGLYLDRAADGGRHHRRRRRDRRPVPVSRPDGRPTRRRRSGRCAQWSARSRPSRRRRARGGYAPTLPRLAVPCGTGTAPFLSSDLTGGLSVQKSGYDLHDGRGDRQRRGAARLQRCGDPDRVLPDRDAHHCRAARRRGRLPSARKAPSGRTWPCRERRHRTRPPWMPRRPCSSIRCDDGGWRMFPHVSCKRDLYVAITHFRPAMTPSGASR